MYIIFLYIILFIIFTRFTSTITEKLSYKVASFH